MGNRRANIGARFLQAPPECASWAGATLRIHKAGPLGHPSGLIELFIYNDSAIHL